MERMGDRSLSQNVPFDMDGFGHRQPGGIGQYLVDAVAENLKIKARFDKPGTIQRSSMLYVRRRRTSREAYLVGKMAVRYADEGKSGFMVTLKRSNSAHYQVETGLVELEKVANKVRAFPKRIHRPRSSFRDSRVPRLSHSAWSEESCQDM